MRAPKHTPGPWQLDGSFLYGPPRDEFEKNGNMIASIQPAADICEDEANRALLEAAPDLLEALRGLLADPYLSDPINADRMAPARAAIAKAAGKEGA